VIGAGPAGTAAAILLAQAGWRVSIVEQHVYPRQKVCGECIAGANFSLLDELGVGNAVRRLAGAELARVGWMRADAVLSAPMPPCAGADQYGRALGRDVFDGLLLERAAALGVRIVQPARVRKVLGRPGEFHCEIEATGLRSARNVPERRMRLSASLVIDAHGSWESGPQLEVAGRVDGRPKKPQRASDLFAFKATFARSSLMPGLLPVLALAGGYGGMVVADAGRTTVALCLRRDALRALRARYPGVTAASAVEAHLRKSCRGVREALRDAQREGSWLAVGPLRPGVRLQETAGVFRVGNASGESHPLVGEGISMALQSSKLLAERLVNHVDDRTDAYALSAAHHAYARAWRRSFVPRLRLASLYAHTTMRTPMAASFGGWLRQWPQALTTAARLAGKARSAIHSSAPSEKRL
jgi:flavin-dependent dehydrogenase